MRGACIFSRHGGSFYSFEEMKTISEVCEKRNLSLHLDGARLFNALVKTGVQPITIGPLFDTLSICLSKGLGAPAGTMLMGSADLMRKARRLRKALGGSMRQVGILAAAGIYALDNNIDRLAKDHFRATTIGDTLAKCNFVEQLLPVDTNIIIFKLNQKYSVEGFLHHLSENNILAVQFGPTIIRMVTHLDIDDEMRRKRLMF